MAHNSRSALAALPLLACLASCDSAEDGGFEDARARRGDAPLEWRQPIC